jgi:2-amino-4-hydroxy-6-hydroxymethyldihydropteridine diphosphokinase
MGIMAYIGLGSNLGDRRAALEAALRRLKPRRVSRIEETLPWGRTDQPKFLNAVAEIETDLDAPSLLERLLDMEREMGRRRGPQRWDPRPIDLDLLLYGESEVHTETLSVPHPRLTERRFVLEGLAELCPEHTVPGVNKRIRELLEDCP